MKRTFITLLMVVGFAISMIAANQTVVLKVEKMDCGSCAAKIEKVLAYEKGVRKLEIEVAAQTVTVVYNDKRTDVETLQKALIKFLEYESVVVDPNAEQPKGCASGCTHNH